MISNEKMCDCNQGRLPCTCKPQTVDQALSGHWVTCSPEWIKAGGNCATAPRILCEMGQGISHMHPAHQPHGEPVALPERKLINAAVQDKTLAYCQGWNACLDEIAKLGPLYTRPAQGEPVAYMTSFGVGKGLYFPSPNIKIMPGDQPLYAHSDPAEVERLRKELAGTIAESERRRNCCADLIEECDTLRAQLAETHKLLKWFASCADVRQVGTVAMQKAAALSDSAEPGVKS